MSKEEWERLTNCEKLRCRICELDVSESTSNKLAFELANIEDEISELEDENKRLNNIINELENFINTYAIPEFNISEEPTKYFMETKIILDKLKELKEGNSYEIN